MKNITVIGAGTMGNGIAHVFAQNGFQVSLVDVSENALQKAISSISKNLDRMLAKEKINQETKESTQNVFRLLIKSKMVFRRLISLLKQPQKI